MRGWDKIPFGEFALVNPRVSLKRGVVYPYISMDQVDPARKFVYPNERREKGSGAKFRDGDTLFARITPCLQNGKIAQAQGVGKAGFGSTEYFVFRGKEGVSDNDFIFYLSKTDLIRKTAENSMTGATGRQRADVSFLKQTPILVPPLPTQRKIAAILSAYDDMIENNLRRITLLEELARETYAEWFVRLRFPGWEGVEVDGGTGLPVGWRRVKLGEIAAYVNRGIAPKYVDEDGIVVINQRCIPDKQVNLSFSRLSSKAKRVVKEKYVQPFDILINSTGAGTLGRVAQIIEVPEPTTVDTHVTIVRPNKEVPAIYLGRVIDYFEDYIGTLGLGATNQTELSRKDIKRLIQFDLPPRELMKEFDDKFRPCYLTSVRLSKQNELLREARDLLLPRLMGGVVEV